MKTKKNRSSSKITKMYPQTKALSEETIKVSDLHTVAFWTYGNPKGKPALFVHGGPGAGTSPMLSRFFDPKAYYIVLVDQRGCGKSTPFAEIRENTTQDLISDFEKIREKLAISKWLVFGGSWGSTLSLAYAIAHPDRVTELVIRGIFLIRKSEVDWFLQPRGTQSIYPDTYQGFIDGIPKSELKSDINKIDFLKVYGKCFKGDYGSAAKSKALMAWSVWETSVSHLHPDSVENIEKDYKKSKAHISMSTIEQHYFANGGFLGDDNYFLDKKNLDRIRHIPTTIVQGRYDVLCPIISAYQLHEKLPHAVFHSTIAGHSALDEGNTSKLVEATNIYKKGFK
jgi:proline iminopeptidase